jgi:hypothetical protein
MSRIIWIQKHVVCFARRIHPVYWVTVTIWLISLWLLSLVGGRASASQAGNEPHVAGGPKPARIIPGTVLVSDLDQEDVLAVAVGKADEDVRPACLGIAVSSQKAAAGGTNQQSAPWVGFDNVGLVVGTTVSNTFALGAADLDGDGDLDLISGDESGSITAWQNQGTPFGGGWTAHQIGTAYLPMELAADDLDDDGDVDLAVAHVNGPTIWQNDGSPFDGEWSSWRVGDRTVGTVRIADMDGDGRLDVVTGGGLPWWREPDDSNWVTVWYAPELPFTESWQAMDVGLAYYTPTGLDVGDLDDDGDNDIVIGTDHAPPVGDVNNPVPPEEWPDVYQIRSFRNDGGGYWTEFDVGRDPEIETLAYVPYHGYWGASVTHVALADLDDDGDLDIIATEGVEGDFLVMGWQNDGTPFSGELWAPSAIAKGPVHNWLEDSVFWAEAIDFDLDGDLDVVSGSGAELEPWPLNLWENSGIAFGAVISETHWLRHNLSSRRETIWAVRVADFDQDGDPDLVTAAHALVAGESSKIRVWENAGFRLDMTPSGQTGAPGEAIAYSVTAWAWRGFSQPIDLWVSGLPVGVEATWHPNPLSPGGSAALTLTTTPNSLERDYWMIAVGIGGRFVRSEPFTLTLISPAGPAHQAYLPLILRVE